MTTFAPFAVIEIVYETRAHNWTYRFVHSTQHGCLVKRVHTDHQLWGHGILTQIYDIDRKTFVPATLVGDNTRFQTVDQAGTQITEYVINEAQYSE